MVQPLEPCSCSSRSSCLHRTGAQTRPADQSLPVNRAARPRMPSASADHRDPSPSSVDMPTAPTRGSASNSETGCKRVPALEGTSRVDAYLQVTPSYGQLCTPLRVISRSPAKRVVLSSVTLDCAAVGRPSTFLSLHSLLCDVVTAALPHPPQGSMGTLKKSRSMELTACLRRPRLEFGGLREHQREAAGPRNAKNTCVSPIPLAGPLT